MIVLLLIVLGLVLGSFVNAFVWRLHKNRDWVNERSECTHCHHQLAPADLVPVVSWLWLRGRCRYCRKKIEDSPVVELALPLLFVWSYYFWPFQFEGSGMFQFMAWLIFLTGFLALTVYDIRWYLLPNKIVFPLTALAVAQVITVAIYDMDWHVLLGATSGALVVAGIFYLLFQISKGKWIGGGDVKLGIVLGLLAGGLLEGFLVLFVASVAGLLVSVPLLLQGKANRKTQLPFGPFLILGLIIVKLFGADIIDWYSSLVYA
jgi:leader peptidase (prepilin peptidase)/N-methyltransferase